MTTKPVPASMPPRPAGSADASDETADRHGRQAYAPTEIPPAGWRDVLMRVFHGISEDRITTIAGGVTFFVLLAIFP
ncbi:MAG: rane protein, partial [Acidobacteriaceae bacterium]